MDYKKKYNNALDRARLAIKDCGDNQGRKKIIYGIFPELAESDDERIRSCIVTMIKNQKEGYLGLECNHGATWDEMLAYLEKQKEQKPAINIEHLKSYMLQYLQDASNREDDSEIEADTDKWAKMIIKVFGGVEQKPAEIDEYKIIKKHITEDSLSSEVNKRLKECGWYITDDKPAEWSEEDNKLLNYAISMTDDAQVKRFLESLRYHPKQEWSENDDGCYKLILKELEHNKESQPDYSIHFSRLIEWFITRFKSLRPQPHWKPSEEQMEAVRHVTYLSSPDEDETYKLYNELKKL